MRDWTEIYPSKGQRIENSVPKRTGYCSICERSNGHTYDCPKCTKEDIYRIYLRAEKLARHHQKKAHHWYQQVQILSGKIYQLKHQINKLRNKQNL